MQRDICHEADLGLLFHRYQRADEPIRLNTKLQGPMLARPEKHKTGQAIWDPMN